MPLRPAILGVAHRVASANTWWGSLVVAKGKGWAYLVVMNPGDGEKSDINLEGWFVDSIKNWVGPYQRTPK